MDIQLQVGVKVLLKNREGKYLLLRRSKKNENYRGVVDEWDIVGGRITPGASLLENLKREVKEETNLILSEEPRLIAAQDILRISGRHVVRLTYVGTTNGEPKLDTNENTEFRWVALQEMKAIPGLDQYLKALLDDGTILRL